MPPVLAAAIPAVIGAGAAIYSGSQQKKAANRALDAQTVANDRSLAEQRAAREQIERLQTPFMNTGYAALDQLAAEFGLGMNPSQGAPSVPYPTPGPAAAPAAQGGAKVPGGSAGVSPMEISQPTPRASGGNPTLTLSGRPALGPQVDGSAYLAANPDVAAFWNSLTPEDQAARGGVNQFAATHYGEAAPRGEARTLPSVQPDNGQTFTRPDAGPAPTFTRPEAAPPPEFTRPGMARPDQPTFNDPGNFGAFSFDASRIAEDPGYKFRYEQGLRALNTGYGARGLLKSGGAMKGVLDYSQGLASQETANAFQRQLAGYNANAATHQANRTTGYNIFSGERNNLNDNFESDRGNLDANFNSDRSYGTNLWADQRDRGDRNFESDRGFGTELWRYQGEQGDRRFENDRGYATSRADTRAGNLFDLAGMGTRAAGAVGNSAQNYAGNAGNIFGSQANAAADAAAQRASANAGMVGSVAGAAANVFNNYVPRGAPASNAGSVNYGSSLNNVYAPRRVF